MSTPGDIDKTMPTGSGPGAALRTARQAMNVEPREVADALNLPVSVIMALEENDFDQLPNAVFARGYVRSYAKLLELDPEPIVRQFPMPAEASMEPVASTTRSRGPITSAQIQLWLQNNQQIVVVAGAIAAGLLLVLLLTWLLSDDEVAAAETAAPVVAGLGAAPTSSPAVVVQTPNGTQPVAVQNDQADTAGLPSGVVESDGANTIVQRLNEGDDRIGFAFTDECWLEIRGADGDVLYSNLGQPNSSLDFVGTGPFNILLGYAPAAAVQFNDEPVALNPHTRNNVATLVLGQ